MDASFLRSSDTGTKLKASHTDSRKATTTLSPHTLLLPLPALLSLKGSCFTATGGREKACFLCNKPTSLAGLEVESIMPLELGATSPVYIPFLPFTPDIVWYQNGSLRAQSPQNRYSAGRISTSFSHTLWPQDSQDKSYFEGTSPPLWGGRLRCQSSWHIHWPLSVNRRLLRAGATGNWPEANLTHFMY